MENINTVINNVTSAVTSANETADQTSDNLRVVANVLIQSIQVIQTQSVSLEVVNQVSQSKRQCMHGLLHCFLKRLQQML